MFKRFIFFLFFFLISFHFNSLLAEKDALSQIDFKKNFDLFNSLKFYRTICLAPDQIISIDNQFLCVSIADSPEKRQKGLMFQSTLAENRGLLFIFDELKTNENLFFWMKNTYIDLAIGFFDQKSFLVDKIKLEALSIIPRTFNSKSKVIFVLEVNKNWFEKHFIFKGAQVIFHTNI